MRIIPMRDMKDTVEIERLCAEERGPVFVTKNGYGRLVVMDIEYYEETMAKIREAQLVNEGFRQAEAGQTVDGKEFMARMAEKYGF